MNKRHIEGWSRREFLGATLAGAAGLLGLKPEPLAAEPPPETTTIKLAQIPTDLCMAPQYMAEQLLREEGFTDIQYIKQKGSWEFETALASGEVNLNMYIVPDAILRLDAGDPIVFLAGDTLAALNCSGVSESALSVT